MSTIAHLQDQPFKIQQIPLLIKQLGMFIIVFISLVYGSFIKLWLMCPRKKSAAYYGFSLNLQIVIPSQVNRTKEFPNFESLILPTSYHTKLCKGYVLVTAAQSSRAAARDRLLGCL